MPRRENGSEVVLILSSHWLWWKLEAIASRLAAAAIQPQDGSWNWTAPGFLPLLPG